MVSTFGSGAACDGDGAGGEGREGAGVGRRGDGAVVSEGARGREKRQRFNLPRWRKACLCESAKKQCV
jgi:hypothetical protein